MFRRLLLSLATVMLLCSPAAAAEKFVVAGDCNFPPFEYLNDKKEPIGYSMDYIKEVAKRAGFEVEIRNVAWDGIFAGLAAGNYDILASSTTITPATSHSTATAPLRRMRSNRSRGRAARPSPTSMRTPLACTILRCSAALAARVL